MKYFKDSNNTVYAYESDGSQDEYIKQGLTAITQQEVDALLYTAPVVPTVLSMRQARRALLQSGYLSQVDSIIAALPGADGDASRIDWAYATEVKRGHPLVAAISSQLPLTSSQLDDLFTLGASL